MPDVAEVTTPVSIPESPQPESVTSVSDHEERYGPNGTGDPSPVEDDGAPLDDVVDAETQQQRMRGSRAKSKMAAARINKLAGENRELKQRLEALEAAQKPKPVETPQHVYRVPSVPTGEFTEPQPKLEDFADAEDPYGELRDATVLWKISKREHESVRGHQQSHVQQLSQQQQQYWDGVRTMHQQRLVAAAQANPALVQTLQSVRVQPPPLLDYAIMLDNDSVNVAVFLASHPEVLDELVLMTAAQPVTEQTVATTRRLLRQRMTAGTTGSVAPSPVLPNTPRPPNPVRTGLIRTGNEPPGEGSSIADHAKFYGPKAR